MCIWISRLKIHGQRVGRGEAKVLHTQSWLVCQGLNVFKFRLLHTPSTLGEIEIEFTVLPMRGSHCVNTNYKECPRVRNDRTAHRHFTLYISAEMKEKDGEFLDILCDTCLSPAAYPGFTHQLAWMQWAAWDRKDFSLCRFRRATPVWRHCPRQERQEVTLEALYYYILVLGLNIWGSKKDQRTCRAPNIRLDWQKTHLKRRKANTHNAII